MVLGAQRNIQHFHAGFDLWSRGFIGRWKGCPWTGIGGGGGGGGDFLLTTGWGDGKLHHQQRPSQIAPSAALWSCNGRASSLLRQWQTHTHKLALLLSKWMLLAQLWRSILSNLLFIYFKNSTCPFLPLCRHMWQKESIKSVSNRIVPLRRI